MGQENAATLSKFYVKWFAGTKIWVVLGILAFLFLATYNLSSYPTTWYDEGSHLHVPKSLIRFNVYADYSSDGYRYYGPTVGVGPTVFLPIALSFKLFGLGLLQGRIIVVAYLLATVWVFYALARQFGPMRLALAATLLLVSSRGIGMLEYGREVLGEVPGLFFMIAGFVVWFIVWKKPTWPILIAAGSLLGLSMVTKNQYFLVLGPTMAIAWVANLVYYKCVPNRVFLAPGITAGAFFVVWYVILMVYLGPANAGQNFTMMREATQGAALVFSPDLMKRALTLLFGTDVFFGLLFPALAYGLYLSLPRTKEGQQWGLLFILAAFNLTWYVIASISWLRYAFPALAISSLFVARFFFDLTNAFHFDWREVWGKFKKWEFPQRSSIAGGVMLLWMAVIIGLPLAQTAKEIVFPAPNNPQAMASYMDLNVPKNEIVETWEPEMGFLTDHNYHFPPSDLLNTAVGFIWLGKESPAVSYHYVEENRPAYVLVGGFARWVQVYPQDFLTAKYHQVTTIGGYELYQLNP